jgi:glutathione S-transferase
MHELTGIAFSHYVEKARWVLQRFAVPYRDRRVLPFFHFAAVYRVHRGKLGRADRASSRFSTPVLRTDDGRILCDSADIVRYVSDRFAPRDRDLYSVPEAAELERYFHDAVGPHTRRVVYATLFEQPELMRQIAQRNVDGLQASAFTAAYPLAKKGLTRFLKIDPESVLSSIDQTRREFDAVSVRLRDGRPLLLGDRFSAADLAFACLASPAVLAPQYSAWLPPLDAFSEAARARTLNRCHLHRRRYRRHLSSCQPLRCRPFPYPCRDSSDPVDKSALQRPIQWR